jgi:hypothetical protein
MPRAVQRVVFVGWNEKWKNKMISTLNVANAARLWYPVMLAQEAGEISESKGAELLGLSVIEYRMKKQQAILAVKTLVEQLPSPLISLVDILREQPELLRKSPS